MIWGMKLLPGQESTLELGIDVNLTLASLDCRPEWTSGDSPTSAYLLMKTPSYENVICTLEKGQTNQQQLDLIVQSGEKVIFKVEGNGFVYLTGYSLKSTSSSRDHSVKATTEVLHSTQSSSSLNHTTHLEGTDQIAANASQSNQSMFVLLPTYPLVNQSSSMGHSVGGRTEVPHSTQPTLNRLLEMKRTEKNAGNVKRNQQNTQVIRQPPMNQHTTSLTSNNSTSSEEDDTLMEQNMITIEDNALIKQNHGISENHSSMSKGCDDVICDSGKDTSLQTQETPHKLGEEILRGSEGHVLAEPGAFEEIPHESGQYTRQELFKCQYCEHVSANQKEIKSHKKSHASIAVVQDSSQSRDDDVSTSKAIQSDSENMTTSNKSRDEVLDRPFKCNFCDYSFKKKGNLRVHARIHTLEPIPESQHCDKCGRSMGKLAKNEKTHATSVAPLECEICWKKYATLQSLKRHKTLMHTSHDNAFKCQFCVKTFMRKQSWKEHETTHTDKNLFQCRYCHKTLRGKKNCLKHEKTHRHKKVLYECKVCKKYVTLRTFKKHEIKHKEEIKYIEEIKKKEEIKHKEEMKHKEEVVEVCGEGNLPYKCKFCEKSFKSSRECSDHQKMHSDTALKCQYCGKLYTRIEYFRRHVDQHLGKAASFQCGYCGKTFTCPQNGRRHEKKHITSAPLKCRFCDKRFYKKKQVLSHERKVHTNVEPYTSALLKCRFCDKRFYVKKLKLSHERKVHTNVKP